MIVFALPSPVQAGAIGTGPVSPSGVYVITIPGFPPVSVSGVAMKSLTPPPGAKFTLTKGPIAGIILVTSTVPGAEPNMDVTPGASFAFGTQTIGMLPSFPGEVGFESLVITGSSTDTAAGGSIISVGILGGSTASYATKAGDTYLTIYSNLLSDLHSDGIDTFQSGVDLTVLSTITDPNTFAGAVDFATTDPNLPFNIQAGTVPEPAGLTLVATGIVGLLGYGQRRSNRG
jgi:hypothetical protein